MNQKNTAPHILEAKDKANSNPENKHSRKKHKTQKLSKVGTFSISSYFNIPTFQNPTGHIIFKALAIALLGSKR